MILWITKYSGGSNPMNELNFSDQVRRASSGSIRLRRSNSPICRRRERRLTRISLTIVWLFLFCHIWKLVPTAYEVIYGDDHFPMWTHYIKNLSHALIVLNSSVNFIIYVMLWKCRKIICINLKENTTYMFFKITYTVRPSTLLYSFK